jgi:hypothetical protein
MAKGIISPETKAGYVSIINKMTAQGAERIIFGCTEIPLLIKPEECTIPVFDTTLIHANAAVRFALKCKTCRIFFLLAFVVLLKIVVLLTCIGSSCIKE